MATRFHVTSSSNRFRERGSRSATARLQTIFFAFRRVAPLTFRPGGGLQRAYSLRRLARGAIRPGDGLQGPYGRNWPYSFTSACSAPMSFGPPCLATAYRGRTAGIGHTASRQPTARL